MIDDMQI